MTFCGRTRELSALDEAWAAVSDVDAPGPRVVALVAESGLGKTRVVQEFYRRLAERAQGETLRYWPATLGRIDDNLTVHAEPDACDPSAPVPFLWWGLRVPDPGARNQAVVGQFAAAVEYLTPHLAPLYRTRRRREHQRALGTTIGKVVLDVAIDAVPFAGLFKTIGETALELGQSAHALWADRAPAAPAEVYAQQRDDIVARTVGDLGVVLSGREPGTLAVPAVVVIDDGHFAGPDGSVTAFLARLLDQARAQHWPLLVIVTYWTSEWHRDSGAPAGGAPTVAGVVARHALAIDPRWTQTVLGPVEDLAPLLREALPGLTPPQVSALLERAGGNPRFLDEIVRWCTRNPKVFEGRRLDGPLHDQGLATVLEKTVELHDLVEQRLQSLAPDVRRALLLASLQGQEFLEPLVRDVASELEQASDDASALETAEHPHAFIRRDGGLVGAFTQRVFHEVAVRCVGNEFDEDTVAAALRQVVWRRITDVDALDTAPPSVSLRTCALASRLFAEADDAAERYVAAFALARLVVGYGERYEYALERQFAAHLADVLDTLDAETVDFYLYYLAANALRQHGEARRAIALVDAATAARRRLPADRDGPTRGDEPLALLLKLGGEICRDFGELAEARARFVEALAIDRAALPTSTRPWADRDVMVSLLNVARVTRQCGDAAGALALQRDALAIARARFAATQTRDAREDVAVCLTAVGDSLSELGDEATPSESFTEALAHQRVLLEAFDDDEARRRLATALERVGSLALERGDTQSAAACFDESLQLRQALASAQDTPDAHTALSGVWRHVGDAALNRGDWARALEAYGESWRSSVTACERQTTPLAHRTRSLALERLATTAFAADDLDTAHDVLVNRLALDVPYAEQVQSPAHWRDVAASHYWLSRVQQARGNLDDARLQAELALHVFTNLHEHLGTPALAADVQQAQQQVNAVTAPS